MYHCDLHITIFSASQDLEAALRTVPARARFTHAFQTIDRFTPEALRNCDVAIINLPVGQDPQALRALCGAQTKLTFCEQAELPEAFWEAAAYGIDEIWSGPLTPARAAFYFGKLLDTIKTEKDLWLTENYLESAINSIPDLVWFKDIKGVHLKVNDAFCHAVGKTKQDVQGRGHYYIWDLEPEEYAKGEYVCLETEEEVLRQRKTCLFDEKVKSKHGLRQFKTYKSPIFGEDGEPIGTVGVAHDVTDLENMGTEMEILLRSMPFSILVVDRNGLIINANDRFETYFQTKREQIVGSGYEDWKHTVLAQISPLDREGYAEAILEREGKQAILEIREEPIHDIFLNLAGTLYIYRDVTTERAMERQIMRNSNTDFLTGLNNRRHFYEYVEKNRDHKLVSLVYVDLDYFKTINDTHGHQAGDMALAVTADVLRSCFPDAFLTRLGGDEFLILLLGEQAAAGLTQRVEQLLRTIEEHFQSSAAFHLLTASVGIAQTDDPAVSIDTLMRQSDEALYQAKQEGRNCFRVYSPGHTEKE